jgi:hypothetical protein
MARAKMQIPQKEKGNHEPHRIRLESGQAPAN